MQRLKRLLLVSFATMLLTVSIPGCAQRGYVQNVDCRSCHTSSGAADARDLSHIYANPSSHHPVGNKYLADINAQPNFNQTSGQSAGVAFFDRNSNGYPDNNEILLFNESGVATLECSSCHMSHGNNSAPANPTDKFYLRVNNNGSALCTTCHRY